MPKLKGLTNYHSSVKVQVHSVLHYNVCRYGLHYNVIPKCFSRFADQVAASVPCDRQEGNPHCQIVGGRGVTSLQHTKVVIV